MNNPSAFPHITYEFTRAGGEESVAVTDQANPGMTLRDYFAAQAMQGHIASADDRFHESNDINLVRLLARRSYVIADTMLAEREREGRPQ